MNCRECERLLVEVARQSGGTEGRRDAGATAALEHAASCPSCAERLADERALTAELGELAAVESRREPSAGAEATLMAAYRTERGREVRSRRWIFAVSGAMAASLVVLLGAALLLSRESTVLVRTMTSRIAPPAARPEASAEGTGQEEVTDFVAFYPGADVGTLDSGALVRVRVPSSELGSFGLPVAVGGDEEWVSADLLVDEDGAPQAIRFVRPVAKASRN
jgi:hypothetical protein